MAELESIGGSGTDVRAERLRIAARDLVVDRLAVATPVVALSMTSFVVLTALTGFTSALTGLWVGPVSLLSVLLLAHIPLVGLATLFYERRAAIWDRRAADLLRSLAQEG